MVLTFWQPSLFCLHGCVQKLPDGIVGGIEGGTGGTNGLLYMGSYSNLFSISCICHFTVYPFLKPLGTFNLTEFTHLK